MGTFFTLKGTAPRSSGNRQHQLAESLTLESQLHSDSSSPCGINLASIRTWSDWLTSEVWYSFPLLPLLAATTNLQIASPQEVQTSRGSFCELEFLSLMRVSLLIVFPVTFRTAGLSLRLRNELSDVIY